MNFLLPIVLGFFALLKDSLTTKLVESTTVVKDDAVAGVKEVVLQVSHESFTQSAKVKRGDEFFAFVDAIVTVNGVPIPGDLDPFYRLPGLKQFAVDGVNFSINFIFLQDVGALSHYQAAPKTSDKDVRHCSLANGVYDLKKEEPTFKVGYPKTTDNIVSKFKLNQIYLSDEGVIKVENGTIATSTAQPLVLYTWTTVEFQGYNLVEVQHNEWRPGPVVVTSYNKLIKTGVNSCGSLRVSKGLIEICDSPPRFLTKAEPMIQITLQGDVRIMGFSSRVEYDKAFGSVRMSHKTDGLWLTANLLKGGD